jgi:hypothetical protein
VACQPGPSPDLHVESIYPASTARDRGVEAVISGEGFLLPARVDLDTNAPPTLDRGFVVTIGTYTMSGTAVLVERPDQLRVHLPAMVTQGLLSGSASTSSESATNVATFTR